MAVDPSPTQGPTVIAPEGELNTLTSPDVRERIAEALDDGVRAIAVDLSRVTFVDSSALGMLVSALKSAHLHGGKLALCGIGPRIRLIFAVTQADKLFPIFDTLDQALAHLAT